MTVGPGPAIDGFRFIFHFSSFCAKLLQFGIWSPFVSGVLDLCRNSFDDMVDDGLNDNRSASMSMHSKHGFFFLLSIIFCHVHGSSVFQLCLVSVTVCACVFGIHLAATCKLLFTIYRFVSHSPYSFCAKLDFDRFI